MLQRFWLRKPSGASGSNILCIPLLFFGLQTLFSVQYADAFTHFTSIAFPLRPRFKHSLEMRFHLPTHQSASSNTPWLRNGRIRTLSLTRRYVFDQSKQEFRNSTTCEADLLSQADHKQRSRSLMKLLDKAEQQMEKMERKFAGKAQKKLQKLQRKVSRKLERLEGSLELRHSLKRISSSPKLIVLAVAACLVAIPAGTIAVSFVAGILQVMYTSFLPIVSSQPRHPLHFQVLSHVGFPGRCRHRYPGSIVWLGCDEHWLDALTGSAASFPSFLSIQIWKSRIL